MADTRRLATLDPHTIGVGYLVLPDSETEVTLSGGTVVAMNRNLLVTASRNVIDSEGSVRRDLSVGFLAYPPRPVEFYLPDALDIQELAFLKVVGDPLPLNLDIPELVGGRLIAGKQWTAFGFPKDHPVKKIALLRGLVDRAFLGLGKVILAELRSEAPLVDGFAKSFDGAPLYAEDPARGFPLAGFITNPLVTRVVANEQDLFAATPHPATELREPVNPGNDWKHPGLHSDANDENSNAIGPAVRQLADVLTLKFGLDRFRRDPTREEYRISLRLSRRKLSGRPARPALNTHETDVREAGYQ